MRTPRSSPGRTSRRSTAHWICTWPPSPTDRKSTRPLFRSYPRRLTSIWTYTRPAYENATFLAGQDLAEIDRTLDLHLAAFANRSEEHTTALPILSPAPDLHLDLHPTGL